MQVNRVVVHAQVDDADAHALARFTSIGVVAGPALPLKVSQLYSIAMVFGTVLLGRMAHSCSRMPKSRSTFGV